MTTPDEEVADRIIEELRSSQLLSETGIKRIGKTLAAGQLTPADWRLAFEVDREKKEDGDATKG